MNVDQAVQYSYMAPNAFRSVNSFDLKMLIGRIKSKLTDISHNCPQSPEKDRTIYQYNHALNVITQVID